MSVSVPRVLPMAVRNLTVEFVTLRDKFLKRKKPRSPKFGYELAPINSALEDPLNPHSSHFGNPDFPPIWVETVNRIKTDLAMIREKGILFLAIESHCIC